MVSVTRLSRSPWQDARWVVLAPHADDETLGAGALIADAASRGRLAGVVYLTDGSESHPDVVPGGSARLALKRQTEARDALRRLAGPRSRPPVFLEWQDAHPFPADSPQFKASRDRLAAMLRQWQADAVAVTAAAEPHCDHAAFHHLAVAAIAVARRRIALFEYVVWAEAPRRAAVRTGSMPPGRRRRALQAHRSQMTGLLGEGFRLPRDRLRMADHDRLYFERNVRAA